ncbi:hypothetical protein LCGC14_2852420, partial [marine sediment metagenome]
MTKRILPIGAITALLVAGGAMIATAQTATPPADAQTAP